MNSHYIEWTNYKLKILTSLIIFWSITIIWSINAWNDQLNVEDECANGNCFSYNVSWNTYVKIPIEEANWVSISWWDEYGEEKQKNRNYENISNCSGDNDYKICEKIYNDTENIHKVIIKDLKNVKSLYLENANITEIKNKFWLWEINLFMSGNLLTSIDLTPSNGNNFKNIDLSNNRLTEFEWFWYSSTYINLSNNKFSRIPSDIRAYRESSVIQLSDNTIYTWNNTITSTINLKNNPINFINITDPDNYSEHNYNESITYKRKAYSNSGYPSNFGYILTGSKQYWNLKINEAYEKDWHLIITWTTSDTEITFNNLFNWYWVWGLEFSVYYIENPTISGERSNQTTNYWGEMEILSPNNNEILTSNTAQFTRNRTWFFPTYQFYYTLSGINNYFTSGYTNNTGISINNLPNWNYIFKVWTYYWSYTYNIKDVNFSINKQSEITHTLTINYVYSGWWVATGTKIYNITGWANYRFESPYISNYTANPSVIEWTMPNNDTVINVIYSKNPTSWWNEESWWWSWGGGGWWGGWGWWTVSSSTYILTIYYQYNDWRTASSTHTESIKEWNRYSVSSPNIPNYTANYTVVEWTMPSSNKTVYVYYTKNKSNYLSVNSSNKYPSTNEWVKVNIETDSDYTDNINFSKLQYRSSTSSSWSNVSRTSSTYVSDYSYDWSAGYYRMTRSDYGYVTLNNLIKFSKSGYYRIYVTDIYGNESYTEIEVEDDSEYNNWTNGSNLTLSTNNYNPAKYEPINITLKTDNYVGKLKLYAKYKDSSNSRIKISNNSSNEYFSDFSYVWENWYYKMTSSDKWKKILYDLIWFKKDWAYRIYAEDEEWYANYFTINVTSSNTTNNQTKTSENTWDGIDKLINQLLGTETNNNNQDYDEIERNKNNLKNVSDEIYKSRSCKEYKIQYNSTLWAYTSPDLQKTEYFINKEYFKRYIDSKNPQKDWCPTNVWWISTNYKDNSSSNQHYIAPNWKVYFFTRENWIYKSNWLTKDKQFQSLNEIKYYIRDRNPLIWM